MSKESEKADLLAASVVKEQLTFEEALEIAKNENCEGLFRTAYAGLMSDWI